MNRRLVVISLLTAFLVATAAACSGDDDDEQATPTATPTATASAEPTATTPPTSTPTTPPTSTPAIVPVAVGEIEVGPIRMTNIRYDPPSGVVSPDQWIDISADVESSFSGELRIFIAPLSPTPELLHCVVSDGNQAFGPEGGGYDRGMRPVDVREGCLLPEEPVAVTGFQISVFELGQAAMATAQLPADFMIDPALAATVRLDGMRYQIVQSCQVSPTVGLVSENLLLTAESPTNPNQLAGLQWLLDEGGVSSYLVQIGERGDLFEGEPGAGLNTLRPDGVVTDETVLSSTTEPGASLGLIRAHARPSTACPLVTQQLDAEAEDEFSGRWTYGVWNACPTEDGLSLWLTDGGWLSVAEGAGGLEAEFLTFDREELRLADDGKSSFSSESAFAQADLRMQPVEGGTTQRVRFELSSDEVACRFVAAAD